jgi:hypothetical protein
VSVVVVFFLLFKWIVVHDFTRWDQGPVEPIDI